MESGTPPFDVENVPLPMMAHVPGTNERQPELAMLEAIAAQASKSTSDATSDENPAWAYGLRLLRNGFYWETHEVLEAVWMNAAPNSRERHLVQGVIHIANAALKVRMDRSDAARRLCELADECIERAFPPAQSSELMGLNAGLLIGAIAGIKAEKPDLNRCREIRQL